MKNKRLIITGHRGAAGLAPENTLAAIELALDLGVDRIEVDIQQTSDGELVVIHNKTLRKTTNGTGFIKRKTYQELLKLSAGIKFNKSYKNEKIPKLSEVIDLVVRDKKKELIIENKHSYFYYHNIERNIINTIKRENAVDFCKVISFNDRSLFRLKKLAPELRYGKLFYNRSALLPFAFDDGLNLKSLKRYDFVEEFVLNCNYISTLLVKKIHEMGKQVHVWTVNEKLAGLKLEEMGVDGLFTDFPNLFLKRD